MRTMTQSTRERLIGAAYELFYRHGFHAVGLDQIIKDSSVTKSTFYNHFESKEALIVAVLEWRASLLPGACTRCFVTGPAPPSRPTESPLRCPC